jgi:hypothetical protein
VFPGWFFGFIEKIQRDLISDGFCGNSDPEKFFLHCFEGFG